MLMLGLPPSYKRLDCCCWFIRCCPGKVLSNTDLAPKAQPDKHCPAISRHWTKCIYLMLDVSANAHLHWDDKKAGVGGQIPMLWLCKRVTVKGDGCGGK